MTAKYEHVTTAACVDIYEASSKIFEGLLKEVRELSRKKPEATMSTTKVRMVNRVLEDLLTFLKDEPEGKYLDGLDDDTLPQVSDAVLAMVQFETALKKFFSRYRSYVRAYDQRMWITEELVAELEQASDEDEDDGVDDHEEGDDDEGGDEDKNDEEGEEADDNEEEGV